MPLTEAALLPTSLAVVVVALGQALRAQIPRVMSMSVHKSSVIVVMTMAAARGRSSIRVPVSVVIMAVDSRRRVAMSVAVSVAVSVDAVAVAMTVVRRLGSMASVPHGIQLVLRDGELKKVLLVLVSEASQQVAKLEAHFAARLFCMPAIGQSSQELLHVMFPRSSTTVGIHARALDAASKLGMSEVWDASANSRNPLAAMKLWLAAPIAASAMHLLWLDARKAASAMTAARVSAMQMVSTWKLHGVEGHLAVSKAAVRPSPR